MSILDPGNPGRRRVFELMRQRDAAIETSSAVKEMPKRRVSPADLEQVQEIALRSFGVMPLKRSDRP